MSSKVLKQEKHASEKRSEIRLTTCVPVKIAAAGTMVPASTKDLSAGGAKILVTTPCHIQAGERYRLELDLPGIDRPIHVNGRIIRIEYQVAFEFEGIRDEDQAAIARYIYNRLIQQRNLGLE